MLVYVVINQKIFAQLIGGIWVAHRHRRGRLPGRHQAHADAVRHVRGDHGRPRRQPDRRLPKITITRHHGRRKRDRRSPLPADGRRTELHVRRPRAGGPHQARRRSWRRTPRTASVVSSAVSATCPRRSASSPTSTRSPGRSMWRVRSPATRSPLHFVSITPARDWAVSSTFPHFGALTTTHTTAMLHAPLEERVWVYEIDNDQRRWSATRPATATSPSTCRWTRCTARSASRRARSRPG